MTHRLVLSNRPGDAVVVDAVCIDQHKMLDHSVDHDASAEDHCTLSSRHHWPRCFLNEFHQYSHSVSDVL